MRYQPGRTHGRTDTHTHGRTDGRTDGPHSTFPHELVVGDNNICLKMLSLQVENVYISQSKKQLCIDHFKSLHESDSTMRIILKKYLNNLFLKKLKFLLIVTEKTYP